MIIACLKDIYLCWAQNISLSPPLSLSKFEETFLSPFSLLSHATLLSSSPSNLPKLLPLHNQAYIMVPPRLGTNRSFI
jgi:hypothetical protein